MSGQSCDRCRLQQRIERQLELAFGPGGEPARCPACGAVWGMRGRRRHPYVRPRTTPPAGSERRRTPRVRVRVSVPGAEGSP